MNKVTIKVGDDDVKTLQNILKNEENFQPQCKEDYLIFEILKQVDANEKTIVKEDLLSSDVPF